MESEGAAPGALCPIAPGIVLMGENKKPEASRGKSSTNAQIYLIVKWNFLSHPGLAKWKSSPVSCLLSTLRSGSDKAVYPSINAP